MRQPWRIRVDTGGTFTDAWACSPEGVEGRCKVLSDGRLRLELGEREEGFRRLLGAAADFPDGLLTGWSTHDGCAVANHRQGWIEITSDEDVVELDGGEEAPIVAARILTNTASSSQLPEIDFRVATTRGTNALLERKGASVAFFITEGLEDLLEIGDQRRPELFSPRQPSTEVLPDAIYGVSGRMDADGTELRAPDEPRIRELARQALLEGRDVAAVALLHAWKNPKHEQLVGAWLSEEGFAEVTLSSDVAPLIRLLPRAETTVADAFLAPVMRRFVKRVSEPLAGRPVWLMTSAGGLLPAERYHPKDSLLSGPAGGLIGAASLARAAGFPKVLSLDMGGTSTDVARIDGAFRFKVEQQIGLARVMAPALEIETVAAGGGSICRWRNGGLEVGPESAGSDPGPACYGRGGPLTLTDVNLLLGLMDPEKAGIPINRDASRERFLAVREAMRASGESVEDERGLLEGIRELGIEKMVEAIRSVSVREGVVVDDHALLAFGGAGPQHACAIAEKLGMDKVLVPGDAGLLSAWGLERAARQEQRVEQVLHTLSEFDVAACWRKLAAEASDALGVDDPQFRWMSELRLVGQDSVLVIESESGCGDMLNRSFRERYRDTFGYPVPDSGVIELVLLRVVAESPTTAPAVESFSTDSRPGPLLFQDRFSTCVVPEGWQMREGTCGTMLLECIKKPDARGVSDEAASVRSALFRSRFEGMLDAMGEALKRTALSTNVKERFDFSCALLDQQGRLVASAPHVPVHLGALGVCVRECRQHIALRVGDVLVTNHPGFGGSHLPDITLIAPVHDDEGQLVSFVANRAHHAELGGMAPGSMPADATCLAEEGVVIPPTLLLRDGELLLSSVERLLKAGPYPSRRPGDNLADLEAQLAACQMGRRNLEAMIKSFGAQTVRDEAAGIVDRSADLMCIKLKGQEFEAQARDCLDDGTPLSVEVVVKQGRMVVDFAGSGDIHTGNLNATPAIVRSVLLYTLRMWLEEDIPLNEGLLEAVDLRLPTGCLNPTFEGEPEDLPAVVGGNVEISQRLADLLCEVLGVVANGPGTMNNFLFGNSDFGYYETIGSGSGAGEGFDGFSGRQVHMTNTAMTDPEILEHRYPVRLIRHAFRPGSGGGGCWSGGDGVVREIEFLEPVTASFLTQRRTTAPRGLDGGSNGRPGRNVRVGLEGNEEVLPGICTFEVKANQRIRIETPGGGGWGSAPLRA